MKKAIALSLLLLCISVVHAQDKIAKGYVLDGESHAIIAGARVNVVDTTIINYTDSNGYFSIDIPRRRRYLEISKENYAPRKIALGPGYQHKTLRVYLQLPRVIEKVSKKKRNQDSAFMSYKNAFSLSLFELGAVAIAVRYERFLAKRHSMGIHVSSYVYGHSYFGELSSATYGPYKINSKYLGFKAAPFYRFYAYLKSTLGVFIDAKIPFGYFNFYDLEYQFSSSNHTTVSVSHSFWTYGVGVAAGCMFALPRTKHGFVNISFGYQYFPVVKGPESLTLDYGTYVLTYHTNYEWWYMPGPGSSFEFKLTMGGIF